MGPVPDQFHHVCMRSSSLGGRYSACSLPFDSIPIIFVYEIHWVLSGWWLGSASLGSASHAGFGFNGVCFQLLSVKAPFFGLQTIGHDFGGGGGAPIILVDYSQKVSLLFQFGVPIIPVLRRHFHSEIFVVVYCSITESEYNPLVLPLRKCFPKEKILAAEEGCTILS